MPTDCATTYSIWKNNIYISIIAVKRDNPRFLPLFKLFFLVQHGEQFVYLLFYFLYFSPSRFHSFYYPNSLIAILFCIPFFSHFMI